MESGLVIARMSEEVVEAVRKQLGLHTNRVNAGGCCAIACGDIFGPGV